MSKRETGFGGWSEEESVTLEVIQICLQVRKSILEKITISSDIFIPLTFRYQIVAGRNLLFKVYVGEDTCAHVMIFQALPCNGGNLNVEDVQFPKPFDDPLIPPKL
nr:cystatin-B-like [Danio rerio]|eukprot:XP_021332055.1 cystatin-B-like [Danio rerio]